MLHCPTCGRSYADDATLCPEDNTPLQADATVAINASVDPLIGRAFDDKYLLDERLGEGGMGTVYRATHLLIDRPVAVKVLNARFVTDEAARERFRREARAAGRLQHTNAVAVTDFGETADGHVYIVMELLTGRSLRDLLLTDAPLDPPRAVALMLQTAAAVAAAHEAGIIHRDLKPGNIFIVQRPNAPDIVKVLDFGIAKLALEKTDSAANPVTLTEAGVMIGTPRYMSPEQCDGAVLTPASDVYSLGIILYEMLTGAVPFTGLTPLAVALKHSSEAPRPLRELNPLIPAALEDVTLHALAKKPSERPPDAAAFRRELQQAAERAGLQPAAGFNQPTLENLRDAGTETPSGRLVIDLERLREAQRASTTSQVAVSADTAPHEIIETSKRHRRGVGDARHVAAQFVADAPPKARIEVPLPHQGAPHDWFARRSLMLLGACLAGLLLLIGGAALIQSKRSAATTDAGNANEANDALGRVLAPKEDAGAHAPTHEPTSAGEFYERGVYYYSTRDYDAALRDFARAAELQKDFPSAHNSAGQALVMKGQFAQAAAEFRTAIEQKGGAAYPAAQYNLGFALQKQKKMTDALAAYNAAINARGGIYPDAFYQIGIIELDAGGAHDPEAADAFRKAIEQYGGRDADSEFGLGTALARQKDYANAEQAFRAAIEHRGGNFPDAHYNLGLMYDESNRPSDAVREYEIYLQQNPSAFNRRLVENSLRDLRRRAAREQSR